MAFKIRTEVKPDTATGVAVSQVPADFLAAMDDEYAKVLADPTKEIIIAGENKAETTLYVQYAKAWGGMKTPALLVTKLPSRRSDNELDARLGVIERDKAPKRGRKVKTDKAATTDETPKEPEAPKEAPKPEAPKPEAHHAAAHKPAPKTPATK